MKGLNSDLSTQQVAEICGVSSNTAIKWMVKGMLKHYLVPMSKHRRVRREDLLDFMRAHGMDDLIPNLTG